MTFNQKPSLLLVVAFVLASVSASFKAGAVWAQNRGDQTLRLGSTELRIGAPKDSVMSRLAADEFSVVPKTSGKRRDYLEIVSVVRHPDNEMLYEVADIYFDANNRVVRIERQLPFNDEHEVLEDIYGLVAKFESAGDRACLLSTSNVVDGDRTLKNATIACGRKSIEIEIWQQNSGKALLLGIQEALTATTLQK
jgi:hypothetical protein